MTQTGTPETDMASIEDMSKMPEFSRMVGMLNDYAAQFHPPTMTEEELMDEAEIEYPKFPFWDNDLGGFQKKLREAHIKARKMGATKMDRETVEKIWDAGYDYRTSLLPEVIKDFGENSAPDKETFLKSINQ